MDPGSVAADWVHPRVCGGSAGIYGFGFVPSGTSPRVRGKLKHAGRVPGATGYIPACAGEACLHARYQRASQVHPRVCGGSYQRH